MSTAEDCLATALAAAFAPEELDQLHGRLVDELVDGAHTPLDDPFGRLVDAIFGASHQGHGCPCPRCRYADAQQLRDETVIDRIRRELYAAGEVIAKVRDAVDQIDAALTAYDTLPTGAEPDPTVPEHEDPARLRGQLADAHADCARYAAERDEARAERDDYARRLRAVDADWARMAAERDRLAAALRANDADPRPATMLRRVPFDCWPEGDANWTTRHGEALDADANAQQLRDEIRGGVQ